ncbi:hypothetical protein NPIL_157451 [Nephila pilipes]|uniref:Uncharacterized protein n=1 Tax=Nephila pilipes TaxID=299642 RepID=A0A8X6QIV8_NEPPI|nr:hypothetical protein NPIL_157451 [Nephila pilipes]
MALLSEKFWILQCRRTIKQVLKRCRNCRIEAFKAEDLPIPLPEKQIRDAATFEICDCPNLTAPQYARWDDVTPPPREWDDPELRHLCLSERLLVYI